MTDKLIMDRFHQAVDFGKKGDYAKAMHAYLSILKKDPVNRNAYINLGSLYSRMNRLPDAMKCYSKALALNNDYMILFNIGCVFYKMNEYKKAVINLEKSKYLNDRYYLTSLVIGLCYSKLKNQKAAEINFLEVLKHMPEQRVAITALSILYYNERRYSDAIALLNKILSNDSKNIIIRELKSNILYETGKIDESAREIKHLKELSNGYRYYDEFIASIPVEIYDDKYGTIDEKISMLQGKSECEKNGLVSLSLCYLFKGETDKAIDYLFEAKKLNLQ